MQTGIILPKNPSIPLTGTSRRLCHWCEKEYLEPRQYACICSVVFCPYCDAMFCVENCPHLLAWVDSYWTEGGFEWYGEPIWFPNYSQLEQGYRQETPATQMLKRIFARRPNLLQIDREGELRIDVNGFNFEADLFQAFLECGKLEYCRVNYEGDYGFGGMLYIPDPARTFPVLKKITHQLKRAISFSDS